MITNEETIIGTNFNYFDTAGKEVVRDKETNKKIFDYRKIWLLNSAYKRDYLFKDRHERLIQNEKVIGKKTKEFISIIKIVVKDAAQEINVTLISGSEG